MRDAAIAVAIALFVTFSACGYISFQEGKAWGQAHQPVRLVPMQAVLKDTDTCCVWINETKVCLPPAILRGTTS